MTTADTEYATTKVVTNRERLSGVVQAIGRRPADIERRWWESAAVFALFLVAYSLIGYWLVVEKHVVGFETLDRFNRGLSIFHNDPAKLSAIGFNYPPLSVVLVAPFTVIPALASSLIVVPIVSAVFAAFTMVCFNTMMRRAGIMVGLRLAVLAGVGLNPLVVMYASTGARNFLWLAFVVAALGSLLAWYVTADIRFVMLAGLSFAIASLTGYGSLIWFLVSLVMVAAILARLGADGREVEGTTVGFAAPTIYAVALWSAFNLILVLNPINWLTESSDTSASSDLSSFGFLEVVRSTAELVFYGSPITIVVLPALIFVGVARRNGFALWLGLMLAISILLPGLAVAVRLTDSPMVMSNALPILLVSVIGAIWLARSAVNAGLAVAGTLVLGLVLSMFWTFNAMDTFRHQGLERAFHDAIATGESQEGAMTLDGSVVGIDDEREAADWIEDNVEGTSAILTDNAQTYAVMLMTGSPETFFDRVDQSDGPWGRAAVDPATHVDYMLLSVNTADDLLSQLYPLAATGEDPALPQVFANDRYVVVEVPEGYSYVPVDQQGAEADTADEETDEPAEDADTTDESVEEIIPETAPEAP